MHLEIRIQLFTSENVYKLLVVGDYLDADFFFPFACWVTAVYNVSITLEFRLFLVEISFQYISEFRNNCSNLKKNRILQKIRENVDAITLLED